MRQLLLFAKKEQDVTVSAELAESGMVVTLKRSVTARVVADVARGITQTPFRVTYNLHDQEDQYPLFQWSKLLRHQNRLRMPLTPGEDG